MWFLFIVMVILALISFYANKMDVISPSFLFSISILAGVSFATLYVNKWNLYPNLSTILVISGGTLVFIIVSYLIKQLFYKRKGAIGKNVALSEYRINNWKIYLFILFEVFVIIYTIFAVTSLTGEELSNFTVAVVKYRNINMFSEETLVLPKILVFSRVAVDASGYWFGYVLINNWFASKKINFKLLIIVVLGMISSFTMGGRNGLVNIVIAMMASYFLLLNYESGFEKTINWKVIPKIMLVFIVLLISFESMALLIGRSGFASASGLDYLAIYIGAPVKNLDIFLSDLPSAKGWTNSQTFIHLVNWLGRRLNDPTLQYKLDLPFQSINDQTLGNVYTTFYPYLYDFGYIGVPILISAMSAISQTLYEFVKRGNISKRMPLIRNVSYTFLSSALLMSFFSNKFYEQHFSTAFIQTVIFWVMFNIFFCSNFFEEKLRAIRLLLIKKLSK